MTNSISFEDYPAILSQELWRPHPLYIARWVTQPQFLHRTDLQPGQTFLMDRFGFWGDSGDLTVDARSRQPDQIIGTENTRQIPKYKVPVTIREFTGPGGGDPTDPTRPGNLKLSYQRLLFARRNIWDLTQAEPLVQPTFHESVGAITLMDDYRRTTDRFYLNLLNSSGNTYNPQNVADGGTYDNGPPKFSVSDLQRVFERLRRAKAPTFPDGYYHGLIDDRMLLHLQDDPRFQQVVQSSAYYSIPMVMASDPRLFGPGRMPPAMGSINYMAQPNQIAFQGMGLNQMMPGQDEAQMPAGFIFAGFRIFTTNNAFTSRVQLTYTNVPTQQQAMHPTGSALRTAYLGFFFGSNAIGEVFGGAPEDGIPVRVKRNMNDDYGRFLILIWQAFFGLALLNPDFSVTARTYGD
jgi:hypothetical protein